MSQILQLAGLLLGLGISAHTIFSIGRNYIRGSREARALAEQLRLEFDVLVELISILKGKADRFNEKYWKSADQGYGELSDEAKLSLEILTTRATQIEKTETKFDLPKLGAGLNKRRMDILLDFLGAFQLYRLRLAMRLEEFRAAPAQPGTLARFVSCCVLDENLSGKLASVREKLGTAHTAPPASAGRKAT